MAFDPREGGEFEGCAECPHCGGPVTERYAPGDVDCRREIGTRCASCAAIDCEVCGQLCDDVDATGACGACRERIDAPDGNDRAAAAGREVAS